MSHLSDAAEAMAAVARTINDDQLADRTPCTEYDVRALVNHLLFWGPSLAGGGRKESVPQPAAAESDVDLAAGDWRGRLLALLDDITSSWAPPSAWEGETSMGTP
ncbi:maleylpyruvate isomerase N-terminal domain-containing protein, partial [Actinomadura geliboluensis]